MLNTKDGIFFNICQQLYYEYNPLKQTRELYSNLINTFSEYSLDTSNIKIENTRKLLNDTILKYYPNEISIKSNFINKVLLKSNNHTTIFELNSGTSRVDLCKINGISIAYEIKTDLDNFNRLDKQLNDYLKLFEKVYVICSKKNIENIIKLIPNQCGIYSYYITKSGRYIFKKEKEAVFSPYIDSKSQLSLFTKTEFNKFFDNKDLTDREAIINNILVNYNYDFINKAFKENFKEKYKKNWNFLLSNYSNILEIDYQWFFKNNVDPNLIYKKSAT